MSWNCIHAGLSDTGRVRPRNEDRWRADPALGLYLVADGMGGHLAGALAAQSVVETLPELIRQRLRNVRDLAEPAASRAVRRAICELSNALYEQSHDEPGLDGMGATVVLALVREGKALLTHMGDSRVYQCRESLFQQLTRDHSLVQVLVDNDELSPDEVKQHPAYGQLTRHVGMSGEPLPDTRVIDLHDGDRLLLCTDGLTDMLEDEEIQTLFGYGEDAETICRRLVDAANAAGGRDNVTVVVVETRWDAEAPA